MPINVKITLASGSEQTLSAHNNWTVKQFLDQWYPNDYDPKTQDILLNGNAVSLDQLLEEGDEITISTKKHKSGAAA